jgi:hypothetical protein
VELELEFIRIRLGKIRIKVYLNLNIRTLGVITLGFICLYFHLKAIWSLMNIERINIDFCLVVCFQS